MFTPVSNAQSFQTDVRPSGSRIQVSTMQELLEVLDCYKDCSTIDTTQLQQKLQKLTNTFLSNVSILRGEHILVTAISITLLSQKLSIDTALTPLICSLLDKSILYQGEPERFSGLYEEMQWVETILKKTSNGQVTLSSCFEAVQKLKRTESAACRIFVEPENCETLNLLHPWHIRSSLKSCGKIPGVIHNWYALCYWIHNIFPKEYCNSFQSIRSITASFGQWLKTATNKEAEAIVRTSSMLAIFTLFDEKQLASTSANLPRGRGFEPSSTAPIEKQSGGLLSRIRKLSISSISSSKTGGEREEQLGAGTSLSPRGNATALSPRARHASVDLSPTTPWQTAPTSPRARAATTTTPQLASSPPLSPRRMTLTAASSPRPRSLYEPSSSPPRPLSTLERTASGSTPRFITNDASFFSFCKDDENFTEDSWLQHDPAYKILKTLFDQNMIDDEEQLLTLLETKHRLQNPALLSRRSSSSSASWMCSLDSYEAHILINLIDSNKFSTERIFTIFTILMNASKQEGIDFGSRLSIATSIINRLAKIPIAIDDKTGTISIKKILMPLLLLKNEAQSLDCFEACKPRFIELVNLIFSATWRISNSTMTQSSYYSTISDELKDLTTEICRDVFDDQKHVECQVYANSIEALYYCTLELLKQAHTSEQKNAVMLNKNALLEAMCTLYNKIPTAKEKTVKQFEELSTLAPLGITGEFSISFEKEKPKLIKSLSSKGS